MLQHYFFTLPEWALTLQNAALWLHIGTASLALLTFWLPLAVHKRSRWHRYSGWLYSGLIATTVVSALTSQTLTLLDPWSVNALASDAAGEHIIAIRRTGLFLLMLCLLVGCSLWQGLRTAYWKVKRPAPSKEWQLQTAMGLTAVIAALVLILGIINQALLLGLFALATLWLMSDMIRYWWRAQPATWWQAHLAAMLGSGIGLYTAFGAFGGRALLQAWVGDSAIWMGWLLPSVIGTIGISWAARRFRQLPKAN